MDAANNGSAIVVASPSSTQEDNVGSLMRRATDVAGVCGQIVKNTAVTIQGRKFVRCEGWQSIAVAYGCVASAKDVEKVAGGIRATGEVRRMSDGAVIASAEGFVGDDEKTWVGRPEYARRAMAQTRAISRVCRSAFAFVVTIIDASMSTTPYEEADFMTAGSETPPPPKGAAGLRDAMRPSPPKPGVVDANFSGHDRELVMPFANEKKEKLRDLSEKNLKWFVGALEKSIDDAGKANFRDANIKLHSAVKAELAFRGL